MARPQTIIGIVTAVLLAATLGILVYTMMQQAQVRCEVCVTYHGRAQCRTAAGPDREEATKTATDNACSFLSSGMTESIQCTNTPPDSVHCSE